MANLISNPGFETNTTGWDVSSSLYSNSGATLTRITSDFIEGSACADVTYASDLNQRGINFRGTQITFVPSTLYRAYAYVKVVSGRPVRIGIRDANGGGTAVTAASAYTSSASWTLISVTFTSGASAGSHANNLLSVISDTTTANGEFLVDAVGIEPVIFGADTGSGADDAGVDLPAPDTGAGTDAATVKLSGATDVGAAVDTAAVSAQTPAGDTGSGTDAAAVNAAAPATDTGSGADTATANVGAFVPASDAGTAAENASISVSGIYAGQSRVYAVPPDPETTKPGDSGARGPCDCNCHI